ncbi:hypothetical protein QE152_g19321 [Popillia japonica]|uniref:EGF-like domain-containing protein n=1 Tax=Popillia japonica TaxID=7064 RepID=A0AAW1KQS3_POPJA
MIIHHRNLYINVRGAQILVSSTSYFPRSKTIEGCDSKTSLCQSKKDERSLRNGNNNQQTYQPSAQGKPCTNHTNCEGVEGTSCVNDGSKLQCLCGNNKLPFNGACANTRKAPNHLCTKSEECVDGAECTKSEKDNWKICVCTNDPTYLYDCNGAAKGNVISGLALVLTIVTKIFNEFN